MQGELPNGAVKWLGCRSVAVGNEPVFGDVELGFLCGLHLLPGELDQDVSFEVDRSADRERVEIGAPIGEGKDSDGYRLRSCRFRFHRSDREADSLDGDGAFGDHPVANAVGNANLERPVGGFAIEVRAGLRDNWIKSDESARPIDVALNDMSAEGTARSCGEFEVHLCTGLEEAERGAVEGFLRQIGMEKCRIEIKCSEADAGDAQRIAFAKSAGDSWSFNGDAADPSAVGKGYESAGLLNDAGEHGLILGNEGTRGQGTVQQGARGLGYEGAGRSESWQDAQ